MIKDSIDIDIIHSEEDCWIEKPNEKIENSNKNNDSSCIYEKSKCDISFYENDELERNEFFKLKSQLSSEITKGQINNDQESKCYNERTFLIDLEKYEIVNFKSKTEENKNNIKNSIKIDKSDVKQGNISTKDLSCVLPRRSTRISKLAEKEEVNKNILKNKNNPSPKKDFKIIEKKTSISKNKKKSSNNKDCIAKNKSKKQLNNPKFNNKTRNSYDESSIDAISTNLDLNESNLVNKQKTKNKKSYNNNIRNEKHFQAAKCEVDPNANLTNLSKTFDTFIKFCQTKFELLEKKFTDNKLSANPNTDKKKKTLNNKKINLEQKIELRNRILNLKTEDKIGLTQIIKKHSKISDHSEIEFDLLKIPEKTLNELKEYVDACLIKEKDDFIKKFTMAAKETENNINEIKATKYIDNHPSSKEKTNEKNGNTLLGNKRKNCILEDSCDLSESLSSSTSNSFSL